VPSQNEKTYTMEVICLRAMDFGESDRIVHLYSAEKGRISAIAKGAKRANSKLAGACERLNLSDVQLASGRSMDVLCQYQPRETFMHLRADLLKLAYGILFADLIDATEAANADSHEIFAWLRQGLHALDAAPDSENANEADSESTGIIIGIALAFQSALLEILGTQPVFDTCIFTREPLDSKALYYCFSPELGGLTSPETRRAQLNLQPHRDTQSLEWVNVSAKTIALLASPNETHWDEKQRIKAQKFLRYYLKKVLDKDVHAFRLIFNIFETFAKPLSSQEARGHFPPFASVAACSTINNRLFD
jgi:DNA repair protein RecO (recombination protein O)